MKRTNMPMRDRRRYYIRSLAGYTRRNYALLCLAGLFLVGMMLGTLLVRSAESQTLQTLLKAFTGFQQKRLGATIAETFRTSFGSSLLLLLFLFVCGFCAISHPAIVAIPLFRGLGFGFSVASLYAYYGLSAIGFVGVLVLPAMLASTLALLLACRESLRLASVFTGVLQHKAVQENAFSLRRYLARFLMLAVACLLSSVLEAGLFYAFGASLALG